MRDLNILRKIKHYIREVYPDYVVRQASDQLFMIHKISPKTMLYYCTLSQPSLDVIETGHKPWRRISTAWYISESN